MYRRIVLSITSIWNIIFREINEYKLVKRISIYDDIFINIHSAAFEQIADVHAENVSVISLRPRSK